MATQSTSGAESPRQSLAVEYADSRTMFENAAQTFQKMQTAVKEFAEAQTTLMSLRGPTAVTLARMQAAKPISEETREVLQRQDPTTARNYADHEAVAGKRTEKTAARTTWLQSVVAAAETVPATLSETLETLQEQLDQANAMSTEVKPAEAYTGETYKAAYDDGVTQHEGTKAALEGKLEPVTTAATAATALLAKVGVEEINAAAAEEELAGLAATLKEAQTTEAQARKVLGKMDVYQLPKYRSHPEDSATMGAVWPGLETAFAEKEVETEGWRTDLAIRKAELEQQVQGFATAVASLKTPVESLQAIQARAASDLNPRWEALPGVVGGAVEAVGNLMASESLGTRMTNMLDEMVSTVGSAAEEHAEALSEKLTGYQAKIEGFKGEVEALTGDRKGVGTRLLQELSGLVGQLQKLKENGWKPAPTPEAKPAPRKKFLGLI